MYTRLRQFVLLKGLPDDSAALQELMKVETVYIWVISLNDPCLLQRAQTVVSAAETAMAARFATRQLTDRFFAARAALRIILGGYLGCEPAEVRFFHTETGKPYIKKGPYFNLSHSFDFMALAVAARHDVGVDLEHITPFPEMASVYRRYFSTEEVTWIDEDPSPPERFFRCWVIREAFVKAMGKGLSLPLESFSLRLSEMKIDPAGAGAVNSPRIVTADGDTPGICIAEFKPSPEFAGAIAVSAE